MFGEWLQPSSQLKGKPLLSILFTNIILFVKEEDTNCLCLLSCLNTEVWRLPFSLNEVWTLRSTYPAALPARQDGVIEFYLVSVSVVVSFFFLASAMPLRWATAMVYWSMRPLILVTSGANSASPSMVIKALMRSTKAL